jgi:hypothetical protein
MAVIRREAIRSQLTWLRPTPRLARQAVEQWLVTILLPQWSLATINLAPFSGHFIIASLDPLAEPHPDPRSMRPLRIVAEQAANQCFPSCAVCQKRHDRPPKTLAAHKTPSCHKKNPKRDELGVRSFVTSTRAWPGGSSVGGWEAAWLAQGRSKTAKLSSRALPATRVTLQCPYGSSFILVCSGGVMVLVAFVSFVIAVGLFWSVRSIAKRTYNRRRWHQGSRKSGRRAASVGRPPRSRRAGRLASAAGYGASSK